MLAVNVQKILADSPQLGYRNGAAVDPADVFPVAGDFPLEEQMAVLVRRSPGLPKPRQIPWDLGELGADKGLLSPGADQLPGGPSPQHRAHGVDDDGLARAGLAGEGVEAGVELDLRLFDHRDILNVKHFQHVTHLFRRASAWGGLRAYP